MLKNKFQSNDIEYLKTKAYDIRREVVSISVANGAGHIAPSLSCVDILTALYYHLMVLSDSATDPQRDRFIISKAHGAYALYAILADIGYLPETEWKKFYKDSPLMGCVERDVDKGLEAGCGSLGHGLPMAVGLAWGAKLQQLPTTVYCLVGDGELQEGSNWEAIQAAAKYKLDNLFIIVDGNNLQAMDFLKNILSYKMPEEEITGKLRAFGAETAVCDGHDLAQLIEVVSNCSGCFKTDSPRAVYARTVKGYGLKAIENLPEFHFRIPDEDELKQGWRDE
jgi:transketolase